MVTEEYLSIVDYSLHDQCPYTLTSDQNVLFTEMYKRCQEICVIT